MLRDARWFFFDMGSTLIDETVCWRWVEETVRGSTVTTDQFLAVMSRHAEERRDPYLFALREFKLRKQPWPLELERPYPDAAPVLSALHERYHIGIVANQGPGVAERLCRFGMLEFVDSMVSSSELGVAKPNISIFLLALAQADCTPTDAVMIGDRLDNDLTPACALGMGTIWVRRGFGGMGWPGPGRTPDAVVHNLREIVELL